MCFFYALQMQSSSQQCDQLLLAPCQEGLHVFCCVPLAGGHFRVLFLSTVRTRHTYKDPSAVVKRRDQQQEEPAEDLEYGFLSSSRMLSTMLPRVQSLLAMVGDPVALCTIGKCQKIWERFISLCHERSNLHGVAMHEIHTQLDNLELSAEPPRTRVHPPDPAAPSLLPQTAGVLSTAQRIPVHIADGRYLQGLCFP
ncbi:UNVERIFIED_CONTAM: hypothetical protein FKN15_046497 [Acipenser sinensis]